MRGHSGPLAGAKIARQPGHAEYGNTNCAKRTRDGAAHLGGDRPIRGVSAALESARSVDTWFSACFKSCSGSVSAAGAVIADMRWSVGATLHVLLVRCEDIPDCRRYGRAAPLDASSRSPHMRLFSTYCCGTLNAGACGHLNLVMYKFTRVPISTSHLWIKMSNKILLGSAISEGAPAWSAPK
jgi:hypothetical protein